MQPLVVLICTTLWTVSGLKIGAFNIQVLGQGKLKDGETLDVISRVSSLSFSMLEALLGHAELEVLGLYVSFQLQGQCSCSSCV